MGLEIDVTSDTVHQNMFVAFTVVVGVAKKSQSEGIPSTYRLPISPSSSFTGSA